MDWEIVFWIVFLLAPFLRRIFRKKRGPQGKAPPARQRRPAPPEVEQARTPFEEALQQIRETLAEENEERSPQFEIETREPDLLQPESRQPRPEPVPRPQTGQSQTSQGQARPRYPEPRKLEPQRSETGRQVLPPARVTRPAPELVARKQPETVTHDPYDPYADDRFDVIRARRRQAAKSNAASDEGLESTVAVSRKTKRLSKWQYAFTMHQLLAKPRSTNPWRPL